MKTLFPILLAVSSAAACGGKVYVALPSSDGDATSGAGGAGGSGGAGGAGGSDGSAMCEMLIADLTAKIAAARACTSVGTWDQCDTSAVVTDECGCGAPLNHESTQAVAEASAAADAVIAAGCDGGCDKSVCAGRYNDPTIHGGCMQQGANPDVGVCTWAGAS